MVQSVNTNEGAPIARRSLNRTVTADLAKESAALEALQIRQQLGAQSLAIANQAPHILLSLFRQ